LQWNLCILFSSFWARFSWKPFFPYLFFFLPEKIPCWNKLSFPPSFFLSLFLSLSFFISFFISFFLLVSCSFLLSFLPSFLPSYLSVCLSVCLSACLSFLLFDFLSLYLKALLGSYLQYTYLVSREFIFLSSPFTDIIIRRNIQISSTAFIWEKKRAKVDVSIVMFWENISLLGTWERSFRSVLSYLIKH